MVVNYMVFPLMGWFETTTATGPIENKYSAMMHFLRELFAKTSG